MKTVFFLFFFVLTFSISGQDCNINLKNVAKATAKRIDDKKIQTIAVWGFFNIGKKDYNRFENYIRESFTTYLINASQNFGAVDRHHLQTLLKEHKLNFDGYIDAKTTKRLGKISSADAVVIGTYSILSNVILIDVKVLDTETAMQIVAENSELLINDIIAELIGKL